MSQSRPTIGHFIRTGQFSKRFNVSKPTDMPDIPEEKVIGGRPASQAKSDKPNKRGSASSTTSNLSTSSTQVGSIPVIEPTHAREAIHTPRPGDLLFVPQDVQTPTTFGPHNEYTAVPSVITYSSARGMSRISIREATPSESSRSSGSDISTTGPPSYPQVPPPSSGVVTPAYDAQSYGSIPIIPPPPNFQPIRVPHLSPVPIESLQQSVSQPRISQLSQASQSIRTSTGSSQSIRTSTTSANGDDAISEIGSTNKAYLATPPLSPPQDSTTSGTTANPKLVDVPSSGASWSLPASSGKGSYRHPSPSTAYAPYHDTPRGGTPVTFPGTLDTAQSRFSWHVSNTERTRNWFTRWFIEWWLMELLSWCFSAICMIIIAIVLWKYNGKELPRWKLGITINAFISIFSGFAKSALLLPTAEALGQLKWNWFRRREKKMMDFEILDSASRGPWGSFVLLARTKGVTLASVGAAIILLSVPLDLFFQQIISYPSTAVLDPTSNATISRAIHYNPNPEHYWQNGSDAYGPDSQLDSFTYPFWQGTGIIPGVGFDCPTGNCTYDPFHTLAVDFQCTEMPNFLEFGCRNTSAEWLTTVGYGGPRLSPNVTSCGYYMNVPDNPWQLMSGYEVTADGSIGEVLATRFFALSDVYTNEQFFNGSVNFKDVKNPIVDFILASTPGSFDGAIQNNTPVVTECEIHWVVKLVNSTVTSGQLTEEALDTLEFPSDLDNPWNPDDPNDYVANFSMTLPDPHSVTGGFSTYGMDNITARKTWQVWAEIAPSTFNRPSDSNPVQTGPVLKFFWLVFPPKLIQVISPVLPWDAPANATQHTAEAVTVMNQVIRRNTLSINGRHDVSVGEAWKYVVIVKIRWVWITLPVILLLFSLIFLVATVVRSTKEEDKIGIWKTSALAILFNGLGEDVQDHVGSGNKRLGYTRSKAKELKVQLDDD